MNTRLVCALGLATTLLSVGSADVRKLQTTATGSQPRARVASVLEVLPSGRVLSVGADLKETKLTVRVAGEPEGQVLARIAQVVGGEWKTRTADGVTSYELVREPAVARWLAEWRRGRKAAERAALEFQAETITRFQNEAFASVEKELPLDADGKPVTPDRVGNLSLTRLVKSFSGGMRDQLVRSMVGLAPVRAGDERFIPVPISSFPFDTLSRAQQDLVRGWCSETGRPAPSEGSTILIKSNGYGLDVQLYDRNGRFLNSGGAVNGAASPIQMERKVHEHLYKLMSAIPTPAGALLGASLTSEGTALPTVVIEDAVLRSQPLESLPSRPMAHEFLLAVAEKLGLNLVADHHTRSTRIEFPPTPTVQQALERAAEGYHLIIRQEGKYLMARCRFWPDRDDEEPPSPAVEEWLRLKAADQNLPLPAIEQLGRLPEVKLIGLQAYRDGKVHFLVEVDVARRSRWVWTLLPTLTERQRRLVRRKEGLPFRELDLRQRHFVMGAVQKPGADWNGVHLYLLDETQYGPRSEGKGLRLVELRVPGSDQVLWYHYIPPPHH